MASPAPTLYFNNALGRIYQHGAEYVRVEWQPAPITQLELRAVYEHLLHVLKRTGLRKVLSDHRHMLPYTPEDREWLVSNWVPRAVRETGYAHCAVVQSPEAFQALVLQRMTAEVSQNGLDVHYFAALDPAITWLVSR